MTLKGKLERLIQGKTSRKGGARSDDTSIVVSVNDRSQCDLLKRFGHLDIDWTAVEKQLVDCRANVCPQPSPDLDFYASVAGYGLISVFWISRNRLSSEHTETITGLKLDETNQRGNLDGIA
jgi:hypothetical protein